MSLTQETHYDLRLDGAKKKKRKELEGKKWEKSSHKTTSHDAIFSFSCTDEYLIWWSICTNPFVCIWFGSFDVRLCSQSISFGWFYLIGTIFECECVWSVCVCELSFFFSSGLHFVRSAWLLVNDYNKLTVWRNA